MKQFRFIHAARHTAPEIPAMLLAGWCVFCMPAAFDRLLAADPWPAEANTAAVKLTPVDPEFNAVNMSGAFWNPATRTLWLANNYGRFHALVENGAGSFIVATNGAGTKARWAPGGDFEGVCQADLSENVVFIMDENGWIREYDVSNYGVVKQNRTWDIRAECPEVGGASGAEGIAFVPDEWLRRQGFRAADGNLYTSTNGMNGLMFVGHQSGGHVHVFDLNRSNGTYAYVGRYTTGRAETAGLEFDRSTGRLYVWHNTGANFAEVTELNSYVDGADRRLRQIAEYTGPRSGNLEGFAVAPTMETNNWCFITDDNNDGGEAITWYRQFQPAEDADADGLPDGWELWHFGTTTATTGDADSDGDGMSNSDEHTAGTQPTNAASCLRLGISSAGPGIVVTVPTESVTGPGYGTWQTRRYDLLNRPDPTAGDWTGVPGHTNMQATGYAVSHTSSVPGNVGFYCALTRLD